MQSATTATESDVTEIVPAETLREMTATKESLFERQKNSILETLMSSMVKVATDNGARNYSANLHPQFDQVLLKTVTDKLTEAGYAVTAETRKDDKIGEFIVLNIVW